jgi:glycine/D-amino acid oxidase-like deaminating enzyme
VATQPWQLAGLRETAELAASLGKPVKLLDASAVRAEVDSPTYLGGLWDTAGCATLDPARLAFGLRRACLAAGVRIFEQTPVSRLTQELGRPGGLLLSTPSGQVSARRVALATGAFSPLLKRLRRYLIPVYDYVLMTEPLSAAQLASIGWDQRQGVGDSANQFHYYRLTRDNRILWGGYDAVYYYGSKITPAQDQRPATFGKLAEHFFQTFPQLEGLAFTHQWGGVIDTCSRFCAFFGTARAGRVAYAAGYTGLGVGASRFGARVLLDLLSGAPTELTELELVRTKPIPFPPEPVRSAGVQLTRWSLARADQHQGRRNWWLRGLDKAGLGFDS